MEFPQKSIPVLNWPFGKHHPFPRVGSSLHEAIISDPHPKAFGHLLALLIPVTSWLFKKYFPQTPLPHLTPIKRFLCYAAGDCSLLSWHSWHGEMLKMVWPSDSPCWMDRHPWPGGFYSLWNFPQALGYVCVFLCFYTWCCKLHPVNCGGLR